MQNDEDGFEEDEGSVLSGMMLAAGWYRVVERDPLVFYICFGLYIRLSHSITFTS